jgi:hypothetical protein
MMMMIIQLIGYALIAGLIMRLKLLFTPYLCVVASYVGNKSPDHDIFVINNSHRKPNASQNRYIVLVLLLALISYQGINNVTDQLKIQGEYSSYNMELMMNWIDKNTVLNDAFLGPMPIMANIKLSTNRIIVNHPHYEDVGLRNRTKFIYSFIYGFRNVKDLYNLAKYELKASYVMIEENLCRGAPPGKPECGLANVALLFLNKTSVYSACDLILKQDDLSKKYFLRVFKKDNLNLFKIL